MPECYITKIEVQNFKSHKHTIMHPAKPGYLTVLSGQSDVGKSSLLHAIEWAFLNNWDTSYLRYGCKFSQVSVTYNDGFITTIKRQKSGGTTYILTNPDGQEQVFEGFGRGIPVEVQEITGVHVVDFGADASFALNFQRQDAGPFLGRSISAPGRSRIIGSLSGCEEIDFAARLLSNQLTKDRQNQKHLTDEVQSLDGKISEYDYLESLGQTIQEVESLLDQIKVDAELKTKLQKLHTDVEVLKDNIWRIELESILFNNIINHTTPLLQTLDQQTTLHENLATMFARLTGIQNDLLVQEEILQSTSQLSGAIQILQSTETSNVKRNELINLSTKLNQVRASIEESSQILSNTSHVEEAISLNYASDHDNQTKNQLTKINDAYIQVTTALNAAGRVIASTNEVNAAELILRSLEVDSVKVGRLISLFGQYGQIKRDIRICEVTMENTSNIGEAENLVLESQEGMDLLAVFFGLQMQRDKVTEAMEAIQVAIKAAERQVTEHESKRDALFREMGVCELCGSEVTEEGLRRVI